MSLGEDCRAEYAFEMDYPHGVNDDEWKTKDGRTLNLSQMSDKHIVNVMNMITDADDFWYRCKAELERRCNG